LIDIAARSDFPILRTINSQMQNTQAQISSGRRFKPVQDNAAYWSIATTMGSNDDAITEAEDALGLGTPK
jgi:flagellin